ncbi:tripartite tricarboxylate transporter TctB family protein [Corynebacterium marquesiae]|uniref:tripartite tricarboxylate transporter TctB family protein n=1 Tax=Corynebacterium marquesiae TaxID=2913503 RepID=UPI00254B093F|nr:tripartite tricarboxylate transporter TctB family protein [Corynebacterium marquesiae]MDK8495921.1 tripartite tricarboxylate transporter TctB family protein [Corynebacterium marquesiae]MDK8668215.1 tripartite tricarboxylate transporter TctB family protein [Corynebacterium marquesiae]
MADKKKLTVAELLARDKKARGEKGGKDDKRSRRHRRSLDEGGISVAELTGNLKKVEASPAEAKHTSVSIDEDAPVIRAPKAADATDADSAKKSTDKPASQSAATTAAQPAAPKAAPKTAAKAEPKAAPKSADKPAAKAAAKPAQTAKPAAATAAQEAAKKNQPSADDTAVIQRVGKAKADDAKPAAAKAAAAKPAAEKPAADKTSADKASAAKPVAEKPKADKDAKAAGAGAATAGAGTAATAAVPASKKAGVAKDAEETGNLPKVEDDEEWIEEEHEKLNPVSILLMIVAGILLAIVIFKGFEILWDSFPRLVVAILALCVTAIMVGVTHALRTARDGFSMFLAGFTGLILTFGPLLLVML